MNKLLFYGLTGFLLALTMVSINSLILNYWMVKEAKEPTISTIKEASINRQLPKALIAQDFSSLTYVLTFSLITALITYLIVKKRC